MQGDVINIDGGKIFWHLTQMPRLIKSTNLF